MRGLVGGALVVLGLVGGVRDGVGQEKRAFGMGYTDLGPTVGLGGLNGAGLSIGGRFEKAIKRLPNLGDGTLGIQVSADYYKYSAVFAAVDYGFSYIPIGATANYHVKVSGGKFDPFFGLGLGYSIVSTSYAGSFSSGIYFIGRAGLRYFMSNGIALYGDVGAGAATLNAGLMFRMGGAR
jgi:hypothetical protein